MKSPGANKAPAQQTKRRSGALTPGSTPKHSIQSRAPTKASSLRRGGRSLSESNCLNKDQL